VRPWRTNGRGWLIRTVGRRGVFLIMFGVIYLVFGVSTLTIQAPRFDDIPWIGWLLDSNLWALLWLAGGVVAVANGVLRARRAGDEFGFVALLIPPAVWTVFYLGSFTAWVMTGGDAGSLRSIAAVMVWSTEWTVVLLIAGWPEERAPDPASPGPPQ